MIHYTKPCERIKASLSRVFATHQTELHAAGVKVSTLKVYSSSTNGVSKPPITLRGYRCAAVIRVTSLRERNHGMGDAEMLIDGEALDEWTDERLDALIDHELTHLQVSWHKYPDFTKGDNGEPKRDDINRPVLKTRYHDFEIGGFLSVIERHGHEAFEQTAVFNLVDKNKQMFLPFESAGKDEKETTRTLKLRKAGGQ